MNDVVSLSTANRPVNGRSDATTVFYENESELLNLNPQRLFLVAPLPLVHTVSFGPVGIAIPECRSPCLRWRACRAHGHRVTDYHDTINSFG